VGAFGAIDISRSGVGFSSYWMETVAHNIANSETVRPADQAPFRSRMVVAQELRNGETGEGVGIGGVREVETPEIRTYDPANPMADAEGYVRQPQVDMAAQMTDLMIANRSYQANLRALQTGKEAYETAMRLGQGR
jgi:flagellar basal-body rod protein FlgC